MRTYIIKRILWMIPTLLIITMVSYGMMRIAPGDPTRARSGPGLISGGEGSEGGGNAVRKEDESSAAREFRRRFHLDQPWYVGYGYWLAGEPAQPGVSEEKRGKGILRGDFGTSIVIGLGQKVSHLLADRIPVTIRLNLWAVAVVYLIAVPAGLYAAVARDSLGDRTMAVVFFVLYSLPSFWVGLLLILAAYKWFPSWPTSGIAGSVADDATYWDLLLQTAKHYVLPVFCLSYAGLAGLSRYARVGMLEVIQQDYIRTARAKGLSEWTVVLKHALRNSVIPLITLMAGMLPGLIGGSIIIEFLFNIPGMGSLSIQALGARDYPVLISLFGISATLTLIGILLSDIAYCLVDPRISLD